MKKAELKAIIPSTPIKLDLCCGKNKKEGFIGVDRRAYEGVDQVADLLGVWPWKNDSVEEIHMSHAMEHFTGPQRVKIVNEMYRVLQKDGKVTMITPHWASNRSYGDFTHQWPPVSEMWFYYLDRAWRKANAPDNDIEWNPDGYDCDFACTWGYSLHHLIVPRNQEAQTFALTFYKEAAQDLIATMVKRV